MGDSPLQVRRGKPADMAQVVRLFRMCFADSFLSCPGAEKVQDRALVDVFDFVLTEEPDGFFVAEDGPRILGYCITPHSMRRLWWRALLGGYVCRWVTRWIRGRYRLPLRSALYVLLDKMVFAASPYNYRSADAQVLSIGVSPDQRGRGIGKALLTEGLAYLTKHGVVEIKLEVRPDNVAGQKLYSSLGFTVVGTAPDRRGGWLVMTRRLDGST